MYTLRFEKRVLKDMDTLSMDDLERIDNNIQLLSQNPLPPGSKNSSVNATCIEFGRERIA